MAFARSQPRWESVNLVKYLRADSDGGLIFLCAVRFPSLLPKPLAPESRFNQLTSGMKTENVGSSFRGGKEKKGGKSVSY